MATLSGPCLQVYVRVNVWSWGAPQGEETMDAPAWPRLDTSILASPSSFPSSFLFRLLTFCFPSFHFSFLPPPFFPTLCSSFLFCSSQPVPLPSCSRAWALCLPHAARVRGPQAEYREAVMWAGWVCMGGVLGRGGCAQGTQGTLTQAGARTTGTARLGLRERLRPAWCDPGRASSRHSPRAGHSRGPYHRRWSPCHSVISHLFSQEFC